MKKINLDEIEPIFGPGKEYYNRYYVYDNYCPQKVIEHFWQKYELQESRTLAFHLQIVAEYGRGGINIPITTDDSTFEQFRVDLEELLKAVYFEHKYNRKKPLKFVEKGGGYEK